MSTHRLFIFGVALLGAIPWLPAYAVTVKSTDDSGAGSLRQTLADAPAGATIDFSVTGTITLTSGELKIAKDVTISGPGAAKLTISGGKSSRVLNVTGGTVTVSGLTVRDGNAAGSPARGGAIYNNGTLTLRGVVVTANQAAGATGQPSYGGGIYNNASLTLAGCVVSDNAAQGGKASGSAGAAARGGGICTVGALSVTESTISGNSVKGGDTSGSGSAGDGEGGGLFSYNNCTVALEATTIRGNKAIAGNATGSSGLGGNAGGGGAVQNWSGGTGKRKFVNCTISGNTTQGGKGPLSSGNSRGAGVWETSASSFTNCTIAGNQASGSFAEGGGLYSGGGAGEGPVLKNTLVAGNKAIRGPDVCGHARSEDYNLLGSAEGAKLTGTVAHNVAGDAKLGALADNGGPTQTQAPGSGSPAIDKIPADACSVKTDQRGVTRPEGAAADIGAFEADVTPPKVASIKPTTPALTNATTATFAISFSEAVRNFDAADLAITHAGTATHGAATVAGGPKDYTVAVTGLKGDGTVTVGIVPKPKIQDMAGNALAAPMPTVPITLDNTPPTVASIAPTPPGPTNSKTLSFAVNFSENVQGFKDEADATITQTGNVAHSGVAITGGPQNYTVAVNNVTGDGTMTLAVKVSPKIRDLVGNPLASSVTSAPVTLDNTPPTLTVAPGTPSPTTAASVQFAAAFSEPVGASFGPGAVANTATLAPDAATAISGTDPNFTVAVTPKDPNASGVIGIIVGKDVTDLAGNPLAAPVASPLITVDHTPPTVAIAAVTPSPTNADSVQFSATFSEPVAPSFVVAAVANTGTLAPDAAAVISGNDPNYTVTVTPKDPNANGVIGILIAKDVKDAAGNPMAAPAASPLITVDNTAPSVTVKPVTPSPTNADAVQFSVTFSEPVAPTFIAAAVANTGTLAPDAVTAISGADPNFSVTVTPKDPNANGTIGIIVGKDVKDPAGNALPAPVASPLVTVDNAAPTVTVAPVTPSPTNADAVQFSVTFSKPVAPAFAPAVVATTGTLSPDAAVAISGDGPGYTATVTPKDPNANGIIGIIIAKDVKDAAGNPMAAPVTSPPVTIDNTPPTVEIKAVTSNPTPADTIEFSAKFSKPVTPTFVPDVIANAGTLAEGATVTIGGTDPAYTVTMKPKDTAANGTIGFTIGKDVKDAAGNALAAPATGPLVTIEKPPPPPPPAPAPPAPTPAPAPPPSPPPAAK